MVPTESTSASWEIVAQDMRDRATQAEEALEALREQMRQQHYQIAHALRVMPQTTHEQLCAQARRLAGATPVPADPVLQPDVPSAEFAPGSAGRCTACEASLDLLMRSLCALTDPAQGAKHLPPSKWCRALLLCHAQPDSRVPDWSALGFAGEPGARDLVRAWRELQARGETDILDAIGVLIQAAL